MLDSRWQICMVRPGKLFAISVSWRCFSCHCNYTDCQFHQWLPHCPMLTAFEQLLNWHPKSTRVCLYCFARTILSGLSACDCFRCIGSNSLIGKMPMGKPVRRVADVIDLKLHPMQLGCNQLTHSTTCVRSHTFRFAMCMVHDIHRKDSSTSP